MRLLFPPRPPQPPAALQPRLTWCLTPSSTDSMLHCISTTWNTREAASRQQAAGNGGTWKPFWPQKNVVAGTSLPPRPQTQSPRVPPCVSPPQLAQEWGF